MLTIEEIRKEARARSGQTAAVTEKETKVSGGDGGTAPQHDSVQLPLMERVKATARSRFSGASTMHNNGNMTTDDFNSWQNGLQGLYQKGTAYLSSDGYRSADTELLTQIDDHLAKSADVMQFVRTNGDRKAAAAYSKTIDGLRQMKQAVEERNKILTDYTEDEYNAELRKSGWLQQYTGKTYSELTDILADMEDGEEKEWLSSYAGYVDQQEKLIYDLDAGAKELETLKKERDEIKSLQEMLFDADHHPDKYTQEELDKAGARYDELIAKYGDYRGAEDAVNKQQAYIADARLQQETKAKLNEFEAVFDPKSETYDSNWLQFTGYDNSLPYDKRAEYLNGDASEREEIANADKMAANINFGNNNMVPNTARMDQIAEEYAILEAMTEEEIKRYNYFRNHKGQAVADEYFNALLPELTARASSKTAEHMKGHYLTEFLYSLKLGDEQFLNGINSAIRAMRGDDSAQHPSYTQQVASAAYKDLGNVDLKWYNMADGKWEDAKILGKSLGQTAFDFGVTSANMAPSILASTAIGLINPTAGAVVGNALMGVSSGGNAYQEMINLGYTSEQATAYGVMVGTSEAVLQYALGGVSKLGGNVLNKAFLKNLDAVDNILAKVAKSAGGKILLNAGSEAFEEGLQSILEPYMQQIVAGGSLSIDKQEALYSALMGFVSGGLFEAVDVDTYRRNDGSTDQEIKAYRMTEASVREQNKAELSKTLQEKGYSKKQADQIAEAAVSSAAGWRLTEKQQSIWSAAQSDPDVVAAVKDALTGEDSSVRRRNQMSEDFRQGVRGGNVANYQTPTAHAYEPLNGADIIDASARKEPVGPAKTAQEAVEGAIALAKERGSVSNNQATRILQTPGAVEYLQEYTGINLPGTGSGNRAAVKNAIMAIANTHGALDSQNPATLGESEVSSGAEAVNDHTHTSDITASQRSPQDLATYLDTIVPKPTQANTPVQSVSDALAYLKKNGSVSNQLAVQILADAQAVAYLQQNGGLMLTGNQQSDIAAVKNAVMHLYAYGTPISATQDTAARLDTISPKAATPETTSPIDTSAKSAYNGTRSAQVTDAITRLNDNSSNAPTLQEIMSIPEIADAERANEGVETINLPDREQIRESGYQKAMQKGSWNGESYSGEVRQEKRMDIVIGLPGSGKSSVYTERLSQEHKSRVIDTDDFREYIPEYNGTNAAIVHEEASTIRNQVLLTAMDNGDNILLSTIGANAEKLFRQITQFKAEGYHVYLHLNELPNNKALARAIGRYISEEGKFGRYVSPELIAGYGDKPTQTYLFLTRQGGTTNGKLEGNLRSSRGQSLEAIGRASTTPEGRASTAVPADLLAGYDWYNNDVEKGHPPKLIQSSEQSNPTSGLNPSVGATDGEGYGQNTVGAAQSRFQHEVKDSKVYTNTYKNATDPAVKRLGDIRRERDPNAGKYDAVTEKERLYNAALRTATDADIEAEYNYLIDKEYWTDEDLATSVNVLDWLLDNDDIDRHQLLARKLETKGTQGGQFIQAFAYYTRANAALSLAKQLDSLTPQSVSPSHFQNQGFETWKKDVSATAYKLIKQVDSVRNGDTASMRQIIRSIARFRKTTAWFGASSHLTKAAERALATLDFDTAKEIALRQISQIPGDFRKRSKGEVLKSIRIKNMLSSLLTIERNLGGNTAVGIMDGLSDSTVGLGLDLLVSKVTGQRTVGFDIKYAPEYIKAAKEGAAKAALCAELDISMDTDTKYEGNATRTHSPQGGPVTRFLSAYEKYLKYALEVTDKFYESGTYAAVEKSLQELGEKSNLQPEQIAAVSRKTASRRTFKDDGALATAAKGLRNAANSLTKSVSPDFGVGDMVLPFAGVGSNVAQTGIDYTAGTVKGAAEIFKLMADAKNGKTIDPGRQRKAITDAARGVTGVGLISLFFALAAKGIIRAGDDEDKDRRALEQSSGLSGAQINIDAALRGLQGKSIQWQKDDVVFTVDFLEPFNTQMYLGYMLSQEDDLNLLNVTGATVQSIMASLMDSPMMQGLNEAVDLAENLTQAEDLGETAIAIGEYVGQTATSFIPGYVRQFAHTVDPIYRDTTGDNAADAAWNQAKAQIPWLSKTLPAKYGADGQPLRRYGESAEETLLGIRNNLLNPVTVTILDDPKLANALGDISDRTGNVTIYPEKQAPKSFTVDGQTVLVSGKEMTENYQRTYMGHINGLYNGLLNDPVFDALPDALKVKSLEYAKQYATEKAKASVSNFSSTGWVSSAGNAPATAILDKVAVASTTDALTNVVNAWKNATDPTDADTAALDATWAIFQRMDKEHQAAIISEQSGRVGAYLTARQAGMSTSVFVDLYKQYWSLDNNITLSDSARAKNWAVDLDHAVEDGRITQKQRNVLWDSLGYWTQIRQDTERYDNLVDSGLSATQSSDLLSTIAAIVPKPGKAQASDAQKFAAIIDFSGLTAKQEDAALREYMSDAQEEKYDQVLDMGLTAQDYLDAYNAIQEESGDGKKKRVIAQFESEFNMTHAQAKALYEIYVKPSK